MTILLLNVLSLLQGISRMGFALIFLLRFKPAHIHIQVISLLTHEEFETCVQKHYTHYKQKQEQIQQNSKRVHMSEKKDRLTFYNK